MGDPWAATDLVQDMPDEQVKIVEAGHLMAAELPQQVNDLIIEFIKSE